MASYVIVDNEITDQDGFDTYAAQIPQCVLAHGGRFLVRGGATRLVEGDRTPHRVVVIEFDNMDNAVGFINDPEYARLAEIRRRTSNTTTFIVEGI